MSERDPATGLRLGAAIHRACAAADFCRRLVAVGVPVRNSGMGAVFLEERSAVVRRHRGLKVPDAAVEGVPHVEREVVARVGEVAREFGGAGRSQPVGPAYWTFGPTHSVVSSAQKLSQGAPQTPPPRGPAARQFEGLVAASAAKCWRQPMLSIAVSVSWPRSIAPVLHSARHVGTSLYSSFGQFSTTVAQYTAHDGPVGAALTPASSSFAELIPRIALHPAPSKRHPSVHAATKRRRFRVVVTMSPSRSHRRRRRRRSGPRRARKVPRSA